MQGLNARLRTLGTAGRVATGALALATGTRLAYAVADTLTYPVSIPVLLSARPSVTALVRSAAGPISGTRSCSLSASAPAWLHTPSTPGPGRCCRSRCFLVNCTHAACASSAPIGNATSTFTNGLRDVGADATRRSCFGYACASLRFVLAVMCRCCWEHRFAWVGFGHHR